MGDEQGEDRRHRIEDRGKPGGDMGLRPVEQGEGDCGACQRQDGKPAPELRIARELQAGDHRDEPKHNGGDKHPEEGQAMMRHFLQGQAGEHEGAAPQ
jgi:hypothetical protein